MFPPGDSQNDDMCWVCDNLSPGEDLMDHAVQDGCEQAWKRLISIGLAREQDRNSATVKPKNAK